MNASVRFRSIELSDPAYEHDGLRFATVKSAALGRRATATFWSPDEASLQGRSVSTLLILLHGVYGDAWVWPFKAGVHRMAAKLLQAGTIAPVALAMPSDGLFGDGSGYLKHADFDAEHWILDEVPALARLAMPSLATDARVAIAGLSMGGYGALRLGAKYPERFSAVSAHSAITAIHEMELFVEEPLNTYLRLAPQPELDPLHWLMKHRDRLPALRFDCGVSDPLVAGNRRLHEALSAAGIAHVYEEGAGGHDWAYWSQQSDRTLRFVSHSSDH